MGTSAKFSNEIFSIEVNELNEYEKRRRSSVLEEIRHSLRCANNRSLSGENGVSQGNQVTEVGLEGTYKQRTDLERNTSPNVDAERSTEACRVQRRWVILVAGFISLFLCASFPFNMSVLYVEFLNEFGKSKAETSLVQSTCSGTYLIAGFLSGCLVTRFGSRKCGIVGGIIACVGLTASFFAMSILYLVGTTGIMTGFGLNLCHISTSSCVSQQFKGKSKLLAMSFIILGSGIGSLFIPVFLEFLLTFYDWRGTLLIIAGCSLNLCVLSCVYTVPGPEKEKKASETNAVKNTTRRRSSISIVQNDTDIEIPSTKIIESVRAVLTHKPYMMFTLAIAASFSVYNSILVFFIDYYQSKGIDRSTAVWIYFGTNVSGCLFRFIPGIIVQISRVPVLAIPCTAVVLGAGTLVVFPFGSSLIHFVILGCVFGICLGCLVSILSITILEITGQKYYSTGLGIFMTCSGIATNIAGPVSGFLRDWTGTYDTCFYTGSICLMMGLLLLVSVVVITTRKDRRLDKFKQEIEVRRKSRRLSSLLPWK